MQRLLFALLFTFLISGCAATELKDQTIDQGGTITDLYYKMALDNLAMFRENPDSLPWHVKIASGTTQIADSASPSFSFSWPTIVRTLGLTASRGLTVQWSIIPATDRKDLEDLKGSYQKFANVGPNKNIGSFSENFGEGTAPVGNLYGRYDSHYVWPLPGHFGHLTNLVLEILGETKALNSVQSIAFPGVTLTPTPGR